MPDRLPSNWLQTLVDEHYLFVYRYARRLCGQAVEAEDLTQQTFLSALEHAGQLRDPRSVRGWLCAIVRNAYLKGKRHTQHSLPLPELVEVATPSPPPGEIDPEELQAALLTLPEEFRTPLILFYQRSLSYKELAVLLEIPIGTVMSRLSRGKALLRQRLAPPAPESSAAAEKPTVEKQTVEKPSVTLPRTAR